MTSLQSTDGPSFPQIVGKAERKNTFKELIKPVIVSLSIFGLYFPCSSQEIGAKRSVAQKIYCVVVLVILLGGICNYTYFNNVDLQEFGPKFALQMLSYLYYALNVITAIVTFRSCWRDGGLVFIFQKWNELDDAQGCPFNTTVNRRRIIRCIAFSSWIYFFSTITLFAFFTFSIGKGAHIKSSLDIVVLVWRLTADTFHVAAWIFPMFFIFSLSIGLWWEFRAFNRDFQEAVKPDGKFAGDFELFRRRHHDICRLVSAVDDNFSALQGAILAFNIAQMLLQLYVVIWHPEYNKGLIPQASMVQWTLFSLTFVSLICFSGGLVNKTAHASLSTVYGCDLDKNREISTKIQVFLSRLTGDTIGLTAWNMFVIDKATILTVIGMIVTYYLVLDQFQSAASSCSMNSVNSTHS